MESNRPVVLLAGGVGVTSFVSMLNTLAEQGESRPVLFIHASQNGRVHAFGDHVRALAARHANVKAWFLYEWPTEEGRRLRRFYREGRINTAWLRLVIPGAEAEYYFCGPVGFMSAVKQALSECGVLVERMHYEFFGPFGKLEETVQPA
jgi:nitric oxide dioxygenase